MGRDRPRCLNKPGKPKLPQYRLIGMYSKATERFNRCVNNFLIYPLLISYIYVRWLELRQRKIVLYHKEEKVKLRNAMEQNRVSALFHEFVEWHIICSLDFKDLISS